MNETTALEAKYITKYFGKKTALSSLSFSIQKGERVALIGPSGAGKTTLLNTIAGIVEPDEGGWVIAGKPRGSYKSGKEFARKVGVIRQHFDLVPQLAVIHNVLAGRLLEWGVAKSLFSLLFPRDKALAVDSLRRVGLADKLYEETGRLSGGEQQRVALARILVQNPEIVLADEPVASLDPARAEDVLNALSSIVEDENQTLIASLHSVDYARKYFTRIIALKDGDIFFDLPTSRVTDSLLGELYKLKEQPLNG
ncbi:phosphonate ABC transporter ATP-binding protein [Neobacillus piezotolerans]|uniref:Phosphonate ABC transporter ATP-binding protein n=1 Tax=Neobacillus piezotolerans TaxID=2259171 RepID=A0A3D8GN41_9BACI|nr:ATP-binding cassette domain-containing protein [Neobacillus piezotolerans]RDU35828.1 phosphonate ABC transporter ATP-binding protein [Neobacillus piezotolerans]